MASGIRVVPNMRGYRALLNSDAVQADVQRRAEAIATFADSQLSRDWGAPPDEDHFEVIPYTGKKFGAKGRLIATNTEHAKRSQNQHGTLLHALDAGR